MLTALVPITAVAVALLAAYQWTGCQDIGMNVGGRRTCGLNVAYIAESS